jgi:hypothetical protein
VVHPGLKALLGRRSGGGGGCGISDGSFGLGDAGKGRASRRALDQGTARSLWRQADRGSGSGRWPGAHACRELAGRGRVIGELVIGELVIRELSGEAKAGPRRGASQGASREARGDLRVGEGGGERRRHVLAQRWRRIGQARQGERLIGEAVDQLVAAGGQVAQPGAVPGRVGGPQVRGEVGQARGHARLGAREAVDNPRGDGGLAQRGDLPGGLPVARRTGRRRQFLAPSRELVWRSAVQLRRGASEGVSGAFVHMMVILRCAGRRTGRSRGAGRRWCRRPG